MYKRVVLFLCLVAGVSARAVDVPATTVFANAYTSLQTAHDALPDSGGELFVPCGTYGELTITKNNVTVTGAGNCAVVQASAKQDNAITVSAGLSNVTIQGLNICGAWSGAADQWDEAHIYIGNAVYADGTETSPITNLTIQNNTISNGNNGILLHRVNGGTVTGNQFVNTTVASLAQAAILTSTSITVSNNTFADSAKSANAIYLRGDGNAFGGNGADTGVSYSSVSNNVASGNYSYEIINVLDGHHLTFAKNQLTVTDGSAHSTGIQLQETTSGSQPDTQSQTHNNVLSGNTIDISVASPGGGNNGITISDQSQPGHGFGSNDNQITGNVIRMAGRGVNVGADCQRNVVSSNDVTITTSVSGFDGIGVSGRTATDTEVSRNTIRHATGHGIDNAGTRTRIANNYVLDGVNQSASGVYMPSSAGPALISGNTFTNNAGRAITISGTGAGVELRDNSENGNGLPDSFSGVLLRASSVSPSLAMKPGEKASLQLFTTGIGGWLVSAKLSCSGLPAGAQCMFSPNSVSSNKNTTINLTITTTRTTAANRTRGHFYWNFAMLLPAILLLPASARRKRAAIILTAIAIVLLCATGCGSASSVASSLNTTMATSGEATLAGNYAVVVSATSSNALTSSVTVNLVVGE